MRIFLAAILVSLAATSAAADSKPRADVGQMVTDDCAKARKAGKQCVLSIESHEIEGGKPVGQGTVVTALPGTKSASLIRIRRDFIAEIVKTAEDL
jgi:hypothetical protein